MVEHHTRDLIRVSEYDRFGYQIKNDLRICIIIL